MLQFLIVLFDESKEHCVYQLPDIDFRIWLKHIKFDYYVMDVDFKYWKLYFYLY